MLHTLEAALIQAIEAIGSFKQVGVRLRPELSHHPEAAGQWLAHCVDPDHRQRLTYAQTVCIFRWAKDTGNHAGFQALAEAVGYRIDPIDQAAEIVGMYRRAVKMVEQGSELTHEALARMKAAGLKVDL